MNPSLTIYSGRFALLWHELPVNSGIETAISPANGLASGGQHHSHLDLLLELDHGQLLTWRLPGVALQDLLVRSNELPALRLANHRGLYLSYEGPISGGRGSVSRVSWGFYSAKFLQGASSVDRPAIMPNPPSSVAPKNGPISERELVLGRLLHSELDAQTGVRCVFQVPITDIGQETQLRVIE